MTFKFVCFDGIKGKELADEVVRENGERKKKKIERKRALWNVLEFGGSGREKRGKKKKKEKSKGTCVEEKKRGKKKKKEKRRKYG